MRGWNVEIVRELQSYANRDCGVQCHAPCDPARPALDTGYLISREQVVELSLVNIESLSQRSHVVNRQSSSLILNITASLSKSLAEKCAESASGTAGALRGLIR